MGNFRKKQRKPNVEIIGVAVGVVNERCEQRKPVSDITDIESPVAKIIDIIKDAERVVKHFASLKAAKEAHIKATEKINDLSKEMERLKEEQKKAKEAVDAETKNIQELQTYLREKGLKI